MGNHIQSVAHPLFFLNITLFSTARITERIWYISLNSCCRLIIDLTMQCFCEDIRYLEVNTYCMYSVCTHKQASLYVWFVVNCLLSGQTWNYYHNIPPDSSFENYIVPYYSYHSVQKLRPKYSKSR